MFISPSCPLNVSLKRQLIGFHSSKPIHLVLAFSQRPHRTLSSHTSAVVFKITPTQTSDRRRESRTAGSGLFEKEFWAFQRVRPGNLQPPTALHWHVCFRYSALATEPYVNTWLWFQIATSSFSVSTLGMVVCFRRSYLATEPSTDMHWQVCMF